MATPSEGTETARVAVIVGGRGNLGSAVVGAFRNSGYLVDPKWLGDDRPDVRNRDAFHDLPDRIDAACYIAGTTRIGPTEALSDSDWEHVLDVNLSGAFRFARAAHAGLKHARGSLIFIGSIMGTHPYPGRAAYAASKIGLEGLGNSLAVEWGRDAIHTHTIRLGPLSGLMKTVSSPRLLEAVRAHIPDGKLIDPADVARFLVFLVEHGQAMGPVVDFDPAFTINRWPLPREG